MKLGNDLVVNTPYDSASQFDANWRAQIARYWHTNPNWSPHRYPEIGRCKIIRNYVYFLKMYEDAECIRELPPYMRPYYSAHVMECSSNQLNEDKAKVQPLLLTEAGFETIAADIDGSVDDIEKFRIYERLFFNSRTDDGGLHPSCHLRTYLGFPSDYRITQGTAGGLLWKAVGAQLGYKGCVSMFGFENPHGCNKLDLRSMRDKMMLLIQSSFLNKIMRGQANNFDLSALMGQYINEERMDRELGGESSVGQQLMELNQKLCGMIKPTVLAAAKSADDAVSGITTEDIQAKFRAQQNVKRQAVMDVGSEEGQKRLNNILSEVSQSTR